METKLLPLLQNVKETYFLWYGYYQILPKTHRHSLGVRIDSLFVEIMEAVAIAGFLSKEEKTPWIRLAIRKTDTLTVLLMILWETRSLDNKKYMNLSSKIETFGKMLGGWNGRILKDLEEIKEKQKKQNSPTKAGEK